VKENDEEEEKKDEKGDWDLNLFHFKILALMVCRGSHYDKAGYLFDLVRAKKGKGLRQSDNEQEQTIIWSNFRLRRAIAVLLIYSDLLPKMFYM